MIEIEERIIGTKTVYISEDHHHSVIPWALERVKLSVAPHVLTLDHHTDTLPAFTHYNETHPVPHEIKTDRSDRHALEQALGDLRHDEHFDFAVRNGIIASAAIFSHVNCSRDVNPALKIVHDPPPDDSLETLGAYYARALETEFLQANLACAPLPPDRPYLLDIDLDYFKGAASADPKDPTLFLRLIRNAAAVTICRERDWVRLLNLDHGKLQYEYFLDRVLYFIAGC